MHSMPTGDPKTVPPHGRTALTAREAAAMLGVSRHTLYRHVRAGTVHAIRLGRTVRIAVEEVERLRRGG